VLATGARAVTTEEAVKDVDVVILSIPLGRLKDVAPLIAKLPAETVVIDTSNYYPQRDGKIDAIDAGQVESLWVAQQLGRPIAKAWNAIGSDSFARKGKPPGSPDRIALPIAADRERDRQITMQLVEESGLEAVDAGLLAESWRQQPGSPCYCTDLNRQEIISALAATDRERLPKRRDLSFEAFADWYGKTVNPDHEFGFRLSRLIFWVTCLFCFPILPWTKRKNWIYYFL